MKRITMILLGALFLAGPGMALADGIFKDLKDDFHKGKKSIKKGAKGLKKDVKHDAKSVKKDIKDAFK